MCSENWQVLKLCRRGLMMKVGGFLTADASLLFLHERLFCERMFPELKLT